ncbi:MAG TPA: autotransporter assembly complex family protein [Patescibacteria group bacterium]|nr:autotransporter assembly complex family protein [Patescibacteria group bacterium]
MRNGVRHRPAKRQRVVGLACALLVFASPLRAEVPYDTEIVGTNDSSLLSDLNTVSQLVTLKDKPPQTEEALHRRVEEDQPRLQTVLQSQGYWEGTVEVSLDLAAKPGRVTLTVAAGPLYRLRQVSLVTPDGGTAPDIGSLDPASFGLKLGDPARSEPVIAAEGKIALAYAERGRPFAKVLDRQVVVDRAGKTMAVTYTVEPGPTAKFGPLTIDGLTRLGQDYVERRIVWQEGQTYDQHAVETTRKRLVDSSLFSSVQIIHAEHVDAAGEVPMRLALVERQRRSLGTGLSYNTSQGLGANGFWEDRNLFGEAESLHVDADVAQQRRDLRANFRKPDFLDKDQDLTTLAELVDENPVAYTARRELAYPALEWRFGSVTTLGGGVQVQQATVTEAARDIIQTYALVGTPLVVRRDTRDDLLNPQSGSRASLMVTPNTSLTAKSLSFVSTRVDGDLYRRIGDQTVLAGFVGLGSIIGMSRDGLPADQRLYAGGGGSLRGYAYQLAGPLAANDKPLGGRSVLQFGTELRVKITDTIGLVPFVEAGNAYETSLPQPAKDMLYDTGIGLRYYTPLGPLRFDVATPLVRRNADSILQVYISIGQAF